MLRTYKYLLPCTIFAFALFHNFCLTKEQTPTPGTLEVICGPMFSGKSEELIRRLRRAIIAQQHVAVFKPTLDNRYDEQAVVSHNGLHIQAEAVLSSQEIYERADTDNITVIGIDEVQFFDPNIVDVIKELVSRGKRVIVAGLDLDFRGTPFEPIPTLLALADKITKLTAICTQCGGDANLSQRLINGMPAQPDDPLILIGAQEAYKARCRRCYKGA